MISAKNILSYELIEEIGQEKVFSYYTGLKINLNYHYLSPFRADKNPTCSFYYSKNGVLRLHDFGTGEQYTALQAAMKKLGLSERLTLQQINRDKDKIRETDGNVLEREDVDLLCVVKQLDSNYWDRYKITTNTLQRFGVHQLDKVFRNDKIYLKNTKENPIFSYYFPSGRIKIYRPLSPDKKKKWYGNSTMEDIGGYKQLPKKGVVCFITSSLKDVMMLHELGFPAVCMNGEGYGLSRDTKDIMTKLIRDLRKRFRFIFGFMDSDEAGLRFTSKLLSIHSLDSVHTPINSPKDISDYMERFKWKKTWKLLKKLLKSKCRNL